MEMTAAKLRELCKKAGLYTTPSLNDQLYLHYQGFRELTDALEAYTGVKVLWLEGNGLTELSHLHCATQLMTLYAHENAIERISGLECNLALDSVNLSKNLITRVEGLSHLPRLRTLNLSDNDLNSMDDIAELRRMPGLTCLDLSGNKLEDPAVLDLLAGLPHLAVLYLTGNPLLRRVPFYRKRCIARMPALKYLDDRPVFPDERQRCEAWCAAYNACEGAAVAATAAAHAAETAESARQAAEKAAEEERQFRSFAEFVRVSAEEYSAREGVEMEPDVNAHSGEAILPRVESSDAAAMREERWQRIVAASDEYRALHGPAEAKQADVPALEEAKEEKEDDGETDEFQARVAAAQQRAAALTATAPASSGEGASEATFLRLVADVGAPASSDTPLPTAESHTATTDVEALD